MADKFLEFKIVKGSIISSPEEKNWNPKNYTNDYYPKYVTTKDSGFTEKELTPYEQKDEFENLTLTPNQIVVDPPISGWGINFENVYVIYNDEKYVVNHKVLDQKTTTFDDEFYRFNSMYSFEEFVEATNENKKEFLKKSWKY